MLVLMSMFLYAINVNFNSDAKPFIAIVDLVDLDPVKPESA